MPTSLWATFSVADHLRPRAFVADVLLYDFLIVPVPDGDAEHERWRSLGRDPDRLLRLLEIVNADGANTRAVPVPWSLERSSVWADRYAAHAASAGGDATGIDVTSSVTAAIRDDVARAVAFDMANIESARRAPPVAPAGLRPPNPDDPAYMMTRMVLADEWMSKRDAQLVRGIPRVDEVEVVVAYGSYEAFREDRGTLAEEAGPGRQALFTFGWEFFVPESTRRTDEDLLREAMELSSCDEVSDWRAAVQRWRRDSLLKGTSDADALRDFEELIARYGDAARKRRIEVKARWGFAVAGAVSEIVSVAFVPLLAIGSALCGLAAHRSPRPIPKNLEAAAIFHEARRRFA